MKHLTFKNRDSIIIFQKDNNEISISGIADKNDEPLIINLDEDQTDQLRDFISADN